MDAADMGLNLKIEQIVYNLPHLITMQKCTKSIKCIYVTGYDFGHRLIHPNTCIKGDRLKKVGTLQVQFLTTVSSQKDNRLKHNTSSEAI